MWMETHYVPFADLIHTVRTGQAAAEHRYGEPFFTWLSHHPEHAARFTGAMANLTGGFKTAAIASLPLDGIETIVDVGGADGTVLATILAAHPHLRGVLYDLPHVITSAPQILAIRGVEDRAECAGGDFFDPCHPAATPTSRHWCCTTGLTRTPSASWPTSPPPAGGAHDCWCSTS